MRARRSTPAVTITGAFAALATMIAAGCGRDPVPPSAAPAAAGPPATVAGPPAGGAAEPWFTDIAASSGLDVVHTTGASGNYWFPEATTGGGALFDFDGDGDLDVYLVQAFPLDVIAETPGRWTSPDPAAGANRLYRNDPVPGPDGRRVPRFTDVTEASGAGDRGYGMGCAVGDVDGDGDLDLFATNFGPDALYRNEGDGTFTAMPSAVPDDAGWSTSAAFLDHDGDGDLDLFVVRYVRYALRADLPCRGPTGARDYCGPQVYEPAPDRFYRNRGDGTFEDATAEAGLDREFGSGLGVTVGDFDDDGHLDLYVANDGDANQLWMNRGDGTFEDRALLAGAAFNVDGMVEAGMGVTAGDFDEDGDEDLFLSHLLGETNTLLVNLGRGLFEDRTAPLGLGAPSVPLTGFGTRWADLDGDGHLDLLVANGAVKMETALALAGHPRPYGNPNQLLRGTGPPAYAFEDLSAEAGDAVTAVEMSRGAAFGDVDGDGDVDVLVCNADGPARLLRNDAGDRHHHLLVALRDDAGGDPFAFGARVEVDGPDGRPRMRRVGTDGSFASASDARVHVGLGNSATPRAAIVTWPGGTRERYPDLAVDRVHVLRRGAGEEMP